ncbi:MAG: ion channel, partial [Pseudomonadota bacterium]
AIVTLTTLGHGDLAPPDGARLVAAFCAVAGLFPVGLSTAFVTEILRRIETNERPSSGQARAYRRRSDMAAMRVAS